jgi:hypothetical protein
VFLASNGKRPKMLLSTLQHSPSQRHSNSAGGDYGLAALVSAGNVTFCPMILMMTFMINCCQFTGEESLCA